MTENNRQKYLREEYIARINRVMDYVEKNYSQVLTLDNLADIAGFSRFHFHRIFKAMAGEPLNRFVIRIRVEKSAAMLLNNPRKTITEIAFDCGFSGSAPFARSFKALFNMSASEWREMGLTNSKKCKTESKESKTIGKIGQAFDVSSYYAGDVNNNQQIWRIKMKEQINRLEAEIAVEDMKDINVAYIRHIGPYKGDIKLFEGLFNRLFTWAGPRGLLTGPDLKVMALYHDDPEITDDEKLRTSVCISVPENTPVDGEVGKMKIPGGKYARGRFTIAMEQFQAAWDTMCGAWFPESGYQPGDGLCYESYLNSPKDHPEGKFIVDIYIPVKPL
jgi:AraC family transcriptional regulator